MDNSASGLFYRHNNMNSAEIAELQIAYARSMQFIITYPEGIAKTGRYRSEQLVSRMLLAMMRIGQKAWSVEGQHRLEALRNTLHEARLNIILIDQLLLY